MGRTSRFFTASALSALAFCLSSPAAAQDVPTGDAPAPEAPAQPAKEGTQSFLPADFARFSPKSALDMLRNVPGFQIRSEGGDSRGLGQATDNVVVNGQRLSSKSDNLWDQLARIPTSSVVRIDIVDGATLSIPGLSGQAANVITRPDAFSGSYNYRAEARSHYSHPGYLSGDVSIKGTAGELEYTLALANEQNRGAFGGGYRILNGDGTVQELRDGRLWSDNDAPKVSGGLTWTRPGGDIGHLNASYRKQFNRFEESEARVPTIGVPVDSLLSGRSRPTAFELSGDYAFDVLGGRLKLIGLDRRNTGNFGEQIVFTPLTGSPEGGRYEQRSKSTERIARAEYGWKWGVADWQLSGEAAFNRYRKDATLFDLSPGGTFTEVPFPGGDGGVREDRYEAILSYGRPLTSKLTMQLSGGAENSTISQTGANTLSRTFTRPKGKAIFSWRPAKGTDVSLNIERSVGQLDFGDFLASANINQGNQNGNNARLVPTQSWNVIAAVKQDLGKWGSTNLRLFDRRFEDYIDVIPLPGGGEGRGNIDKARRYGFEWTSTFQLDPLGFKGAKLDTNLILQTSSLRDPLTGEKRQLSYLVTRQIEMNLRHDIPGTDWAWGTGFEHNKFTPYYRLREFGRESEGPVFDFHFIEHKDVLGMTVRFQVINLADARHRTYREVHTGRRDSTPILFIEDRKQKIGPIFRFTVKGSF